MGRGKRFSMQIRQSSRRPSLTSATSRSGSVLVPFRERGSLFFFEPRAPRIRFVFCKVLHTARSYGFSSKRAMRWNPGTRSRADLNSEEGASENSCRERAEITTRERRAYAPRRSFRDSNTSAMGDNGCDLTVGSTMQLYQGDVGLQPVLQIAGACLARETRRLASGVRSVPSVARGSRARRTPDAPGVSNAVQARAALPDPLTARLRYRPPRRSSRAREQDRRRREALPRDAFGRRALRHRHAHVVAEPVRRGRQAQEVLRDQAQGLLRERGEQQEVRPRPRAPRRRLENLGTPLRFSPTARGKRGHPLSRARRAPRTDRGAVG